MFDNCKNCRRYHKTVDNFYRDANDWEDLDGNTPDIHYCIAYGDNDYAIPDAVWDGKTRCPHYFMG